MLDIDGYVFVGVKIIMNIEDVSKLLERVIPKAQRELKLKGAPMVIFQTEKEAVWIMEDQEMFVATWDGYDWVFADEELSIDTLKLALFEYAISANYDTLVIGKEV